MATTTQTTTREYHYVGSLTIDGTTWEHRVAPHAPYSNYHVEVRPAGNDAAPWESAHEAVGDTPAACAAEFGRKNCLDPRYTFLGLAADAADVARAEWAAGHAYEESLRAKEQAEYEARETRKASIIAAYQAMPLKLRKVRRDYGRVELDGYEHPAGLMVSRVVFTSGLSKDWTVTHVGSGKSIASVPGGTQHDARLMLFRLLGFGGWTRPEAEIIADKRIASAVRALRADLYAIITEEG